MTNTELLEEHIKASGYKKSHIAKELGISRYGFSLKCQNKAEFRASEIEILSYILKLKTAERMAIFFSK